MLKLGVAFPLVALWLAHEAEAWWDSGHYLAACVARKTLIDAGRQDVVDATNKLVALYDVNGVTNDICRAACWMDWIKSTSSRDENETIEAIKAFDSQHYIDFLTTKEATGPTEEDIDVMLANVSLIHLDNLLKDAMYLVPPKNGDRPSNYGGVFGYNLWMRWLLHLMGDAHMPLHMSAMYSNKAPESKVPECDGATSTFVEGSDAGGNGILVKVTDEVDDDLKEANPGNLHALWDSMGGYGTLNADDISDEDMFAMADHLIENYPATTAVADLFNVTDFTLKEVYMQSAFLAGNKDKAAWDGRYVYKGIDMPTYFCPMEWSKDQKDTCCNVFPVTKEYGQWVKETSKKLVAIAGYRLADILTKWHDGMSDRLRADIEGEYKRQTSPDSASSLIVGSAAVAVAAGAFLY